MMKDYNKLTTEQQAQVDELIASFKPEFDWEEFYPKKGTSYWYLNDINLHHSLTGWTNETTSFSHFKVGNYFLTEKGLTKDIQRKQAVTKWNLIAKKLNGDWKEDWEDSSHDKWFIYYDACRKLFHPVRARQHKYFPYVHLKSEELCQQAMDIMGEEDMKLLLGVEV